MVGIQMVDSFFLLPYSYVTYISMDHWTYVEKDLRFYSPSLFLYMFSFSMP
jgi:hypothetical protein